MKPFASIVIPVFNQLEYTKKCIDSLLKDSERAPVEIIVVDNASTDGTREWLDQLCHDMDRTQDTLVCIFNDTNKGVAPAWNQGASAAHADNIAIINNDIIVSKGWIRSVLWAMETFRLDLASPFAATGKLDYDFEKRATTFVGRNLTQIWHDYDFCAFVMKKDLYRRLGPFDEKFIVGGYEDTDYVWRMKKEKLAYGVTGAAFIHHFGSSTLGEFKKRGDEHAAHNRDYFMIKWNEDPSAGVGSIASKLKRTWRKFKMNWDLM